jgi:drug/metabolite transporter (DMT)-like permease
MNISTPAPGLMTMRLWLAFWFLALVWGSTWVVIKYQVGEVPPGWSVTWRFFAAGLMMFALCRVTGKNLRLNAAEHRFAMLMGLTQFMLNFTFIYHASTHLTSGLLALTFALLVVPNAILSRLFLGTPITRQFAFGSAIGISGVLAMFWRDIALPGAAGDEVLLGLALALCGLFSVSVANVLAASPRGREQPLEGGIAWAMAYGTLLNFFVSWAIEGPPVIRFDAAWLGGLLYLALAGSVVTFVLYYQLIRAMGAGRAAYIAVIIPVVALTISTLVEGYIWTPLAVFGAVLALLGLLVALRSR